MWQVEDGRADLIRRLSSVVRVEVEWCDMLSGGTESIRGMKDVDERTKTERIRQIYLGEQLRGFGVSFNTPETDVVGSTVWLVQPWLTASLDCESEI
jgi:hypothetical protein